MGYYVHADLHIPVYRQRLFFISDTDLTRGKSFLQTTLAMPEPLGKLYIDDPTSNASSFMLDHDDRRVFVIWIKDAPDTPTRAAWLARLSHECLHSTIQLLNFIGFKPPLKSRYSEPITYLHDAIVRLCLESLDHAQSQYRSAAHRRAQPARTRKQPLTRATTTGHRSSHTTRQGRRRKSR